MLTTSIPREYWVVLPGFNEEKYIGRVLKTLTKLTPNVIVVDDGSSDETANVAKRYTPHVLRHQVNLGKGAALKTGCEVGFKLQHAKAVIIMDSDDQHDPQEIVKFVAALEKGHQLILGVRDIMTTMPLIRRLANTSLSVLIQVLFGRFIPDIPSGYKAFTQKMYPQIRWGGRGYEVETEIAARIARQNLSFSTVNISTIYHDYDKGMTFLDALKLVLPVINWRFTL